MSISIPPINILEDKSIEELNILLSQYGAQYKNRFDLETDAYLEISNFYISCSMMIENLKSGYRRWWRITIPMTEDPKEGWTT